MAINSNLLLQIMALSEEDKYELTQALIHSGTTQTTPKVEQPMPIVETSPKRIDTTPKAYADTVVYTRVSHDGKGVEFYVLNASGDEKSAYPFMNGVIKLMKSEDDTISLQWDKSIERTEKYAHTDNVHKHGAHLVLKNGKAMSKAKVLEWVNSHSQFVLTAESKAEYFEKKNSNKDKQIEKSFKTLKKYGLI